MCRCSGPWSRGAPTCGSCSRAIRRPGFPERGNGLAPALCRIGIGGHAEPGSLRPADAAPELVASARIPGVAVVLAAGEEARRCDRPVCARRERAAPPRHGRARCWRPTRGCAAVPRRGRRPPRCGSGTLWRQRGETTDGSSGKRTTSHRLGFDRYDATALGAWAAEIRPHAVASRGAGQGAREARGACRATSVQQRPAPRIAAARRVGLS